MENTLRHFYQEIRSKSKPGEYTELLEVIEKAIDKLTPKKTSSVKSHKELWKIIEDANWEKDNDYVRIKEKFKKLPKKVYKQLIQFIDTKHDELNERFQKDWLANPGIRVSDDGWSDLRAEVIGRGKKFYDAISVLKLKEMAKNLDYTESFLYTIQ